MPELFDLKKVRAATIKMQNEINDAINEYYTVLNEVLIDGEEIPDPDDDLVSYKVLVTKLNIRREPNPYATDLGDYFAGDVFDAEWEQTHNAPYTWVRSRKPVDGWVAIRTSQGDVYAEEI